MSVEALTWALKEPIAQSSMKFVLVVFANCAGPDDCEAYPSTAYLVEATSQDRKTVQANVKRLIELGYIEDTGGRKGRTKQVIIYRVNCPSFVPRKQAQKRDALKRPDIPGKEARFSHERGPKTGHGTQRKPKEINTPQPPDGGQPGFAEFFGEFPKQVDEDKAREQWDRLAPDAALREVIRVAVVDWRASVQWQKEGGSLIPKPHNWLRNKGWRNVPGIAKPPRKPEAQREPDQPAIPVPESVKAFRSTLPRRVQAPAIESTNN